MPTSLGDAACLVLDQSIKLPGSALQFASAGVLGGRKFWSGIIAVQCGLSRIFFVAELRLRAP